VASEDWGKTEADWDKLDKEWLANQRSEDLPRPFYRMPLGFGRQPGPRNFPEDQKARFLNHASTDLFRYRFLTDGDLLNEILPPGIEYFGTNGDPELMIWNVHWNICWWIAGRPYSSLSVAVPCRSRRTGRENALYYAISYHNIGDNMISAREELGWPTMPMDYDSMVPLPYGPDGYRLYGKWLGFRFLEMEFDNLVEVPELPGTGLGHNADITFRYLPNGYTEGAAHMDMVENNLAEYFRGPPNPGVGHVPGRNVATDVQQRPRKFLQGDGTLRWNKATFFDMPGQYHFINRMAEFPILEMREVSVSLMPSGGY
jgi:acetoacetate decarboxylase